MKNRTGVLKGGTDTSGVEQQQVFRRDPRSFQWRDMSGETRKRKKRSGREGKGGEERNYRQFWCRKTNKSSQTQALIGNWFVENRIHSHAE